MKGHKNTGKKENNRLKNKKGNIVLLVLLLLILMFPAQRNLLQKYRHKSLFLPNLSVKLRHLLPQNLQREPLKYWIPSKERYLK